MVQEVPVSGFRRHRSHRGQVSTAKHDLAGSSDVKPDYRKRPDPARSAATTQRSTTSLRYRAAPNRALCRQLSANHN